MKYIVIALDGREDIFVFSSLIDHDRMAEACMAIRFGSGINWNRKYRGGEVVAAGFVNGGCCFGRSETLGLESRGEVDTKLLEALQCHAS